MIYIYIVLGLVILWGVFAYNSFVSLINRAGEAWADIDVQLKRRYDLIPNLVNTVKGYTEHERGTLDEVVSARAKATQATIDPSKMNHNDMEQFSKVQGDLSMALGKLLAISENYPDLKADTNFLELQRELSDTENKIQSARRFYNGNVRDLNIKTESFPSNTIAKLFGFMKMEFFKLAEDSVEKNPVEVKF